MKKLLIYLLLLNSFNLAAQSPNYVPSNNLIGWWPFNGNANDESGNANNGIVNGASLTNDRFGNSNSAYQFNGISSYIQGSLSGLTSTDETSLSIWILSDGDAGGKPYDLFFQLGNYGSHTFAYAYNYSGTNLDLYSNCFINPYTSLNINNQWHHLVIVDDISSSSVYLDGSLYFTWNLQQGAGCYFGSNTFLIGGGADNQYTTGYLDDVGFWDRALTECEIQNLYNSSVTIINTIDNVGTHCDSYTWIDGITYTSSNNTATWLTTNAAGCDNLVTLNLIINNSCLFMPNLFTPNGDGIHDIWLIDGLDLYPDVLVQVFNRWGQLLFESKGYSDPWDGTYNGNALPIGAYYYMINLNNNTEPLNGTITIKL